MSREKKKTFIKIEIEIEMTRLTELVVEFIREGRQEWTGLGRRNSGTS
jgi:hypothetical protein